jgi:hypothetical protein
MNESTVTIPLEEYEKLKKLEENYLDKCYEFANKIHKDWAKSEVYFEAIKQKKLENEREEELFLKRTIEHWKKLYLSLRDKVNKHNERFLARKIDI